MRFEPPQGNHGHIIAQPGVSVKTCFWFPGKFLLRSGIFVDSSPLVSFVFRSLLAGTHQNDLPGVRLELQKDLRAFIKKVGPELGEIYTKPDLKWGDLFRMQKVGVSSSLGRSNHSGPKDSLLSVGHQGAGEEMSTLPLNQLNHALSRSDRKTSGASDVHIGDKMR